jgi:pimeloyl-ACP methyl ester carboxylesterase
MHLFFQSYGASGLSRNETIRDAPLVILHGLLGSSDNWHSRARKLSEQFRVFSLDARNHGRSPHSEEFNYHLMVEDLREFIEQQKLGSVNLLGHSMGGKTAMLFAIQYPELVERLIVVDIAPKPTSPSLDDIFEALFSLDLAKFKFRKEIDEALAHKLKNATTRQFVLKNLKRSEEGKFSWKVNLDVVYRNMHGINSAVPTDHPFTKPTLFIRGANSRYILDEDLGLIQEIFPNSKIATISNAGHWVHADNPAEFDKTVMKFLNEQ